MDCWYIGIDNWILVPTWRIQKNLDLELLEPQSGTATRDHSAANLRCRCRYLIFFQAYVSGLWFREYPNKIWPEIWYVYVPPSVGSWNSHWTTFLAGEHRYAYWTHKRFKDETIYPEVSSNGGYPKIIQVISHFSIETTMVTTGDPPFFRKPPMEYFFPADLR